MSVDGSGFRCADAARDRPDAPLGTAPQTARWLLIEHPGPWRIDALGGSGLPGPVQAALHRAARAIRGRVLLIRRPGRQPADREDFAWAVSTVGVGTAWGRWREPEDLAAAVQRFRAPEVPGADEVTSTEPLLLVCTHGVHDICCALRGRPVAAALAEQWPEATWECSHLGGDRFAGNVVVLPDGAYYGNLDADSTVAVVGGHLGGRVDVPHLRGMARFPPPGQVAVGVVHERFGPYGAADVVAESIRELGPTAWEVEVSTTSGGRHRVRVTGAPLPAAQLTCRAVRETSATGYTAELL